MSKKKTTEQYKLELKRVNEKTGTNIRLKEDVEYVGDGDKITHICTCEKEWKVAPTTVLKDSAKSCGLCNSRTFEQWCIENNREDVLNRWDYELNNCKPSEITHGTHIKYYFKCPREIHKSELKKNKDFIYGKNKDLKCKQCNSFAQWSIDNIGEDFLEKYWDYEKNTVDPWEIDKCSLKTIYVKCQEKDYHGSYPRRCLNFINGVRCSYCNKNGGKVHPLDSLGKALEDKGLLYLWSDRNKKSPYKYAPMGKKDVYWKCPEGKHKDYKRNINRSNTYDFRCPECQYSKGEKKINDYLINSNFVKINQNEFNQLINEDIDNYYIPQKEFNGLVGLGNGNLSYDFYLPDYNLLIEYQGEQHEKYIPGFHETYEDFEKQVEHDRRKKEYALIHNIKLLEIWYWDYDNIEEILEEI